MDPIHSKLLLLFFVCIVFASCNTGKNKTEPAWSDLLNVTKLEKLQQTDFSVTLENPITANRNIIYTPAFLFAWDKVKEVLKTPIIAGSLHASSDFKFLNIATSHKDALIDSEYTASVEIENGAISVAAFFNKTLPFATKLQALTEPILFYKTNVAAFGMSHYDEEIVSCTRILCYKDDGHFILQLSPKDKEHQIILAKGIGEYQYLKDAITITNNLIAEGKIEQDNNALAWKYEIAPEDIFAVPVVSFNISTQYKNLIGQQFSTTDNKQHTIEEAYQRTGFILNENGAVVESEAALKVDTAGAMPPIKHPKKMIFNSPFLIILKRVDKTNPYFVMKVANAELLTKK
jgi:hypothetical protein